jgi:hypothetical protein
VKRNKQQTANNKQQTTNNKYMSSRINDLFRTIASNVPDEEDRARLYKVVRAILIERTEMGIENSALEVFEKKKMISAHLKRGGTLPKMTAAAISKAISDIEEFHNVTEEDEGESVYSAGSADTINDFLESVMETQAEMNELIKATRKDVRWLGRLLFTNSIVLAVVLATTCTLYAFEDEAYTMYTYAQGRIVEAMNKMGVVVQ